MRFHLGGQCGSINKSKPARPVDFRSTAGQLEGTSATSSRRYKVHNACAGGVA
jgi:hypothetical protein